MGRKKFITEYDEFNRNLVTYMLFVAIFGRIFLYIQAYEIWERQDSRGVSKTAYFVLLLTTISWLSYGYITNNKPLIYSGIVGLIGTILVLYLIYEYENGPPEDTETTVEVEELDDE